MLAAKKKKGEEKDCVKEKGKRKQKKDLGILRFRGSRLWGIEGLKFRGLGFEGFRVLGF